MTTDANSKYSDTELRRVLNAVFRSVYFVNTPLKRALYYSYLSNLGELVDYARANNINPKEHIRSIRKILLTLPQTYTKHELKCALRDVFSSVEFDNPRTKNIIQDSYFASFDSIIAYATERTNDPIEYINGIRDMLLQMPGCYAMEKVMKNITCPYDNHKCLEKERGFCIQSEFARANNLQPPVISDQKSECPMSVSCLRYPKLLLQKQRTKQHG